MQPFPSTHLYNVSNCFRDDCNRFEDPSLTSKYGWVGERGGVDSYLYVIFPALSQVSGIQYMGATMASIGITKFHVKYSKTSPPDTDSFIYSAYNSIGPDQGSREFTSMGDNCKLDVATFANVYSATALRITPLTWRSSENAGINAPGMRIVAQQCV